jgi:hypothetical protein
MIASVLVLLSAVVSFAKEMTLSETIIGIAEATKKSLYKTRKMRMQL